MPARPPRTPSYRHHKPSNQAVVTIDGRDFYLGRFDSPESRAGYDRLISEWLANGRTLGGKADTGQSSDISIDELILAFLTHADRYYCKNGEPTSEPRNIRLAMGPLRRLYGPTQARDFGPKRLKAVRQEIIAGGICRNEVNKRVRHIVRMFKWARGEELLPGSVHTDLKEGVPGLKAGRTDVRESEPVRPVEDAAVEAVRPYVLPAVWAMIELQRLTGARPGEIVIMRTGDIDRSGTTWTYIPHRHKTEHHGRHREIYLGPKAQAVLTPWFKAVPTAYLFSAAEATETRLSERRAGRRTPYKPPHHTRARKKVRRREPGERYSVESYCRAIARACDRAFPHPTLSGIKSKDLTAEQREELAEWRKARQWHPHQLRHASATAIRRQFGAEVAQIILGHTHLDTTEIYAERDREAARAAMERAG